MKRDNILYMLVGMLFGNVLTIIVHDRHGTDVGFFWKYLIISVIAYQSWLGRRFNYGTANPSFADNNQQKEIVLRNINTPMKYKTYFDQHLQAQGWAR